MTEEEFLRKTSEDLDRLISTAKYDALTQEVKLPDYIQLELDYMDDMFDRRMQDPRA